MLTALQNIQTVPIGIGISLQCESMHHKRLHIIAKHLAPLAELLKQLDSSPSIADYFDEALDRFISANDYSVKGRNLLTARLGKLKQILIEQNPDRIMADLSTADIVRIKRELPKKIKQNAKSKSRGENTQTYYQLFNRVMGEAKNDGMIAEDLFIKSPRKKAQINTKPFLADDLSALTTAWPYASYTCAAAKSLKQDAHAYKFWLLPLGLYTGARLNELCQLRTSDILFDDHGVPMISINDNGGRKSLKNAQSRRHIPVCTALLNMGFMEFVAEQRKAFGKTALLFNELTYSPHHLYSRSPSRFFCGQRTGEGFIGQYCSTAIEGALNFKSCRRSFAQKLESAGTPDSVIAHLLGHQTASNQVTHKHYLDKPYSVLLLDVMEQGLGYGIETQHINWADYRQVREWQQGRAQRGRKSLGAA